MDASLLCCLLPYEEHSRKKIGGYLHGGKAKNGFTSEKNRKNTASFRNSGAMFTGRNIYL